MCGIVGCVGYANAAEVTLDGLRKVEYRGYDSVGLAVIGKKGIEVRKSAGRLEQVESRLMLNELEGKIAIGHTRWATHGGVSDVNAHPHLSCNEDIAVVHNGIIENYFELKKSLLAKGHRFKSETDTEVIAHLIEEEFKLKKSFLQAVLSALRRLKGQYAIAVITSKDKDAIIGARKDAPLIVGIGNGMNFIASDVLAFIKYTDRAVFLDNLEAVEIRSKKVEFFRIKDGKKIEKKPVQVAWEISDITKKDYTHFTLKEIHEQVFSVKKAFIQQYDQIRRFAIEIVNSKNLFITGAGTSYHASLIMSYRLKKELKLRPEVFLSGEYKNYEDWFDSKTALIAFSQSGETADLLEAVRKAKEKGSKILSIVNAANSTLFRESDLNLLLNCGPEVGVAATKSFTSQIIVANLVVDELLALTKGEKRNFDSGFLSNAVKETLKNEEIIKEIAHQYSNSSDFYFVARGYNYPVAIEGALKLKELSYIHAEGMPASELKHGTLALIENGTPVVVINPTGSEYDDTLSNVEEMRARGADIIGVSDVREQIYKYFIKIPRIDDRYLPVVEVIPLQMLAYHMAVERSANPDYPRNLAKSVTVK